MSVVATANERKALLFLALVALSGSAVRLWRAHLPRPDADAALVRQIERVDSVRALRHTGSGPRGRRRARVPDPRAVADSLAAAAPADGEPLDVDRATAEELERLPGIGPALASRIVTARDSLDGFGQIEALCVVKGIGPALVARLRPLVTFTAARRPLDDACGGASRKPRKTGVARTRQPR